METHILISSIFGLGFFIQAIFGFGGGLVAMLLLPWIIPIESALATVPIIVIVACVITVLGDPRSLHVKHSLTIYLKSLPGLLLAAFLLRYIPPEAMILTASALILLYCLNSVLPNRVYVTPWLEIPLSLLAGFTGVISGVWALYVPIMTERVKEPNIYRITLNFLWVCLGCSLVPIYFSNGYITRSVIMSGLWSIPTVMIATFFGRRVAAKIRPEMFRKMILIFLVLIAAFRIVSVLIDIFSS